MDRSFKEKMEHIVSELGEYSPSHDEWEAILGEAFPEYQQGTSIGAGFLLGFFSGVYAERSREVIYWEARKKERESNEGLGGTAT